MAELAFADGDLQVLHHQADSAATLVVFNVNGEVPDGRYFWGMRFAAAQGLNTLGVMGASNWFPRRAMLAALPALRARLRGPVIAYGSSMGGYAALKYSALLGATAVVAFAPQVSIDPSEVPWDRRWTDRFDAVAHAGMRIVSADLAGRIAVVFDPHAYLDTRHVALLPPGPALLRLPFSGHGPVTTLAQARLLPALFTAVQAGDFAAAQRVVRQARLASHHHLLEIGLRLLLRRRFDWIGPVAARMEQLDDAATACLLRACVEAGRGDAAAARGLAVAATGLGTPHRRVVAAYAALVAALSWT